MLIVPQDDQGDSEVTNQAWVPEVGKYLTETACDCWEECEVMAVTDGWMMVLYAGHCKPETVRVGDIDLKPIPTDEDKAVEEMMEIVIAADVRDAPDVCRVLHEAGYRKQEAQPDLSDPANWMDGDILVCTECSNGDLKEGGKYPILGIDSHLGLVKVIGSHGKEMWAVDSVFKFHSRP